MQTTWLEALFGAVHRLAWHGPDPQGERTALKRRFEEHLAALAQERDREARGLAALIDLWHFSIAGESLVSACFELDERVPDHALREALEGLREAGLLMRAMRPHRFHTAVEALRAELEITRTIQKSPGPEIWNEARDEGWRIVHAADAGQACPPLSELRLHTDDLDDWAAEPRQGSGGLQQGLKVHITLVKHLRNLRSLVRQVADLWTMEAVESFVWPEDAPVRTKALFPRHHDLAFAALSDVQAVVDGQPDRIHPILRPETALVRLGTLLSEAPMDLRVEMLGAVAEAVASAPELGKPDWAVEAESELESVKQEIRRLQAEADALDAAEVRDNLTEARENLELRKIGEASTWIEFATNALRDARANRRGAELAAEQGRYAADLDGAGLDVPAKTSGATPEERHEQVRRAWQVAIDEQKPRLSRLVRDARTVNDAGLDEIVSKASTALDGSQLAEAVRLLAEAEARLAALRERYEARVLPAVRELGDAIERARLDDATKADLQVVLGRITLRAEEGLDTDVLLSELRRLLEHVERGSIQLVERLVVFGDHEPFEDRWNVVPVALTGLGIATLLPPTLLLDAEQLESHHADAQRWTLKVQRGDRIVDPPTDRLCDVIPVAALDEPTTDDVSRYRGAHDLSEVVFVADESRVQGPYEVLDQGVLRPADPRGFVARLDRAEFASVAGVIEVELDGEIGRLLVVDPPSLDDLLSLHGEPFDKLDAAHLERWLALVAQDIDELDFDVLARLVERLGSGDRRLPTAIVESRLEALSGFLETSQHFDRVRRREAERWVSGERGERERALAAERIVKAHREEILREVHEERSALEAANRELMDEVAQRRQELVELEQRVADDRERLEEAVRDLREEVEGLEALREDARARALLSLLGSEQRGIVSGATRDGAVHGSPADLDCAAIEAAPFTGRAPTSLASLVREVTDGLDAWSEQEVGNLLVSLLTSPWTLLAGPPGVGKSTFVRTLLRRLGHGPSTPRYLELVVRRDWQDDAALFGFWHPEERRWVESGEGFVEHLLAAADDERRGLGGLYACVLEELNLASPEYYLSRPISALEAQEPTIRLYGQGLTPGNAARYPSRFRLAGNVRLIGTVNVDDTVERLSPRFLSRASVIWMEPSVQALRRPLRVGAPPDLPVRWDELMAAVPQDVTEMAAVHRVIEFLHEQRVPGMPSPRTVRAIERYMAAAGAVMPETVAQDFQVLQRILPSLRGVGARYHEVFGRLADLLRQQRLQRSARRVEALRQHGRDIGDYYDFFHA